MTGLVKPEDVIARATREGATFEQASDGVWTAIAKRRGRPPLVTFNAPKQAEAAAMYLRYFGHKD